MFIGRGSNFRGRINVFAKKVSKSPLDRKNSRASGEAGEFLELKIHLYPGRSLAALKSAVVSRPGCSINGYRPRSIIKSPDWRVAELFIIHRGNVNRVLPGTTFISYILYFRTTPPNSEAGSPARVHEIPARKSIIRFAGTKGLETCDGPANTRSALLRLLKL